MSRTGFNFDLLFVRRFMMFPSPNERIFSGGLRYLLNLAKSAYSLRDESRNPMSSGIHRSNNVAVGPRSSSSAGRQVSLTKRSQRSKRLDFAGEFVRRSSEPISFAQEQSRQAKRICLKISGNSCQWTFEERHRNEMHGFRGGNYASY